VDTFVHKTLSRKSFKVVSTGPLSSRMLIFFANSVPNVK